MEAEENSLMINQRIKLKETAYFVLGKAWPHNIDTQSKKFDFKQTPTIFRCLYEA